MCILISNEVKPGHLHIACEKTKKPITVSNHAGMFCEDLCDFKECVKAEQELKGFISDFLDQEDGKSKKAKPKKK